MRSPVLEMGVASAAELDERDAAALGAFRRDLARSLHNLAYRLADQGQRDEALAAAEEARHHPSGAGRQVARCSPRQARTVAAT